MAKNLMIVESPAKAKTIEKYLGKDFQVKSCYGHIRDLEKDEMGIDVNRDFEPRYIVPEDKRKVVNELKKLAKSSEEVWLASDEDREGESISWHLCEVLDLKPEETKRIVFHEITKPAIQQAIANPRTVDMNLVNAQQARRVLDRIVGFEISPVLWRKIGMQRSLSAGRVQSVAVKLITEREREINSFEPVSHFAIKANFAGKDLNEREISFAADGSKFDENEDARKFLESCIGAGYTVKDIAVKPGKRSPAAPFTTSTLQQEASRKLGYSVSRTMMVAQKLYEAGHITYMRTDSVNLSDTALGNIGNVIENQYGKEYLKIRKYKTKSSSAQEAHEAIRPTYMEKETIGDADGRKLYELIWKRTVASQMAEAITEKTTATIEVSTNKAELTATGEVIRFDGFLKVYMEGTDDDDAQEDGRLPELRQGQQLRLIDMTATQKFSRPAARYTEASLVKKMEELGIGRPSTYAPTISTIQKRNYIEKSNRDGQERVIEFFQLKNDKVSSQNKTERFGVEKGKLFPTDLGFVVTDFLNRHFEDVMDYGFTASIENEFDKVASGTEEWSSVVRDFYHPFKKDVEETLETADRATGERLLGEHPEHKRPVFARMGRYGPMVQIGTVEDEEKPLFASLRPGQSIETIDFEQALELFKLPFTLGNWQEKEVSVGIGRFGPYVKFGDEFISIPRGEDPLEMTMERAQALIRAKQEADAPIATYKNQPVTRGKGRFGPFIKFGDLYVNVPRRYDFENLSQEDIRELIDAKLEKEANRYIHQWPEEKIAVENGRWGPFVRFGKKMLKLGKPGKTKYTQEEAEALSLEEVKEIIKLQVPDAFEKKARKAPAPKKAASKTARKTTARKSKTATKK